MSSPTPILASPLTWTLLYRGSRDGFSADDFHRCCDGKGPTVVIVRPRGVDRVIGGFNSRGWESTGGWSRAPGSFIFSIGNSVVDTFVSRLRDENNIRAIVNHRERGPHFGLRDLHIVKSRSQEVTG